MRDRQPAIDPELVRLTHSRAGAARWGVGLAQWEATIARSIAARFKGAAVPARDVREYVLSLQLEDLALATACAGGAGEAWDHFVLTFRPVLYRSADAARGTGEAREVADALFGELYGVRERAGQRVSLLAYYHGRASLAGWLRTVFAQRLVDRIRAARRLVPFDEAGADHHPAPADEAPRTVTVSGKAAAGQAAAPWMAGGSSGDDPDRARYLRALRAALTAAIAALDAGLRLRMALYYGQGLKLAAIGRLVGESEATVSRRLEKARRQVRADVVRRLREEHALVPAQVDQAIEYALDDEEIDLGRVLPGPGP